MAVKYVSTAGGGNGTSTSSRWTIGQAKSGAASGDIVKIAPGYYAEALNPSNGGTTWEAEDPTNKPIFIGSVGATTGLSVPPSLTGWSLVNGNGILSYSDGKTSGSAHPYVYRKSGFADRAGGVWVNHPEDVTPGVTTGTPTGYYHSLWRMHQDPTNTHDGAMNPDLRIHDCGEQSSYPGELAGNYSKHDWQAMACSNTGGTLDIRLHSTSAPNPNNYYIAVCYEGRGKGFDIVNLNGITFRNLVFRYWVGCQVSGCASFTLDGCEIIQMGNDTILGGGSHNAVIKNCKIIGAGAWMHHGHDCFVGGDPSTNGCLFQNNTVGWGAHGALTLLGKPNDNWTIRGNTFHHAGTLFSIQYAGNNLLVENNTFRDSGFLEDVWNLKSPHPAMEFDGVTNAVVRRNVIARCGWGMWTQANSGQLVQNLDIRHNTFVDCQLPCVRVSGSNAANHSGNQIRRNVFYGPSGGNPFGRGDYLNPTAIVFSDGVAGLLAKYTFRENVYWPTTTDGITPLATRGTDIGNRSTISQAGSAMPAVFGSSASEQGPQSNPLFIDRANSNFGLQSGSPAINIGTQLAGETGNDAGAFEFGGAPTPTNNAPSVTLTASPNPAAGTAPLTVAFDANASDPVNSDGSAGTANSALVYAWTFGDGQTANGTGASFDNQSHVYQNPGNYTCQVQVSDNGSPIGPVQSTTKTIGVTVTSGSSGGEITTGLTIVNSFGTNGVDQTNQTPAKLIDGSWSSNGGTAGQNNWARSGLAAAVQGVIVDIGRQTTLTRVLVSHYPGGGGTRNYNLTLATSPTNSGGSYTDIGTTTTALSPEFTEISFSPRASVRYVKLTVNASVPSGYDFASIWEMRLYEASSTVNVAPTLNLTSNVSGGAAPLSVTFTSGAADPLNSDGSAGTLAANLVYAWDFGDGQTSNGTGTTFASRTHSYATPGTYTCTVRVTDAGTPALFTEATKNISVVGGGTPTNVAPNVNLQTSPSPATISAGGSVTFTANANDPVNSDASAGTPGANLSYVWDFGDGSGSSGTGTSFDVRSGHVYAAAGTYVCSVTVSDNGSPVAPVLSTTKQVTVTVGGGGSNVWPIVDAWDNLGTPGDAIFAPQQTLLGKVLEDGDHSARWVSPVAIVSGVTSIGWDLGQNRAIKRIRLPLGRQINGWIFTITVQYSTNKTSWTTVPGLGNAVTGTGGTYSEYVLGNAISARYIRVLFHASNNGMAASFAPRFSDS